MSRIVHRIRGVLRAGAHVFMKKNMRLIISAWLDCDVAARRKDLYLCPALKGFGRIVGEFIARSEDPPVALRVGIPAHVVAKFVPIDPAGASGCHSKHDEKYQKDN